MIASATIRSAYVRASVMNLRPTVASMQPIRELETRAPNLFKIQDFKPINHLEHRENCEKERFHGTISYDVHGNSGSDQSYIDNRYLDGQSFIDFDDGETFSERVRKMYTLFLYRDPIDHVAIVFAVGSLDLVINAFFDLLLRAALETAFETEETIAVPATVLIGAILFFAAGIFDTFGALNADRSTLKTSKENLGSVKYKPALLGSPEFKWIPSREKFVDLATTNLAFPAGLIVLFGGLIFMFAGIVDFPGVVSEESSLSGLVIFGPQVNSRVSVFHRESDAGYIRTGEVMDTEAGRSRLARSVSECSGWVWIHDGGLFSFSERRAGICGCGYGGELGLLNR